MRRPRAEKICDVVMWLQDIGVSLYGPNMNTETGEEFGALMDYDVEQVLARYEHIKNNTLTDRSNEL